MANGRPRSHRWRRCNTCGHTNYQISNAHKVWNSKTKKMTTCGTMRVLRYWSEE